MAGARFIPSHLLLLNRKGQALPQAQPFLHSFRGCVIWALELERQRVSHRQF